MGTRPKPTESPTSAHPQPANGRQVASGTSEETPPRASTITEAFQTVLQTFPNPTHAPLDAIKNEPRPSTSYQSDDAIFKMIYNDLPLDSAPYLFEQLTPIDATIDAAINDAAIDDADECSGKKDSEILEESIARILKTENFHGYEHVFDKASDATDPAFFDQFTSTFLPKFPFDATTDTPNVDVYDPAALPSTSAASTALPTITKKNRYVCRVCSKLFTNASKCDAHTRAHRSQSGDRPPGTSLEPTVDTQATLPSTSSRAGCAPFLCHFCRKPFTSKFKLMRHQLIHSDARQFSCHVCERTFHRKDHLKNHVKVHDPTKSVYICDREHCQKEYTSILSYRKHLAIHAAEEGHLDCKICAKRFDAKQELLTHLKIHLGSRVPKNPNEKKYRCDMCDRKFFTKKDVRRHSVVHTGRRDFLCQYCPQRFGRKDHLVRHIKKGHTALERAIKKEPHELRELGELDELELTKRADESAVASTSGAALDDFHGYFTATTSTMDVGQIKQSPFHEYPDATSMPSLVQSYTSTSYEPAADFIPSDFDNFQLSSSLTSHTANLMDASTTTMLTPLSPAIATIPFPQSFGSLIYETLETRAGDDDDHDGQAHVDKPLPGFSQAFSQSTHSQNPP